MPCACANGCEGRSIYECVDVIRRYDIGAGGDDYAMRLAVFKDTRIAELEGALRHFRMAIEGTDNFAVTCAIICNQIDDLVGPDAQGEST